jgi:hypothetical protein
MPKLAPRTKAEVKDWRKREKQKLSALEEAFAKNKKEINYGGEK